MGIIKVKRKQIQIMLKQRKSISMYRGLLAGLIQNNMPLRTFVIICAFFLFNMSLKAQVDLGLPVWPLAVGGGGNAQIVDWTNSPPLVQDIPNTAPSDHGGTGAAFDRCGELVFYVIHTGVGNIPNNLFIYAPDGTPLLTNTTPNAPGLNGQRRDREINVVNVPGTHNQWYIIYSQWKTDAGAPSGNGAYTPAETLFARVEYDGNTLTVIDRDIVLTANGIAHTYTHGKAVSRTAANPNEHYLYLCRRTANNHFISLDRFIISNTGITFSQNTGNVPATWWYLTIMGSPIELSPTEDRIAVINRNQSANYDDIIIFDTQLFSNAANAYQTISLGNLVLQPDGIVQTTAQPITQVAQSNSSLTFLSNMEKKVADIEFSPNGRFLYFTNGGYAQSNYTNTTYLGQIDLGPVNQPATYPYDVRLQIQKPPGNFNPNSGAGGMFPGFLDQWLEIACIQASYDGNLYFTKRNSDTLYVLPDPDQFLPQMLTPGNVDLSSPTHPNIIVNGTVRYIPDQIDGWDYLPFTPPSLDLGNDTTVCTGGQLILDAGSNFLSYLWQDGSTNSTFDVTQTGTYYVAVLDSNGCMATDTVNIVYVDMPITVSNDTTICYGTSVQLFATGGDSYLWSHGHLLDDSLAANPTAQPNNTTTFTVLVTDTTGCANTDSVTVNVEYLLTADFSASNFCEGDSTFFDDNSNALVGSVDYWEWDFGDGNAATGTASPSHVYQQSGIYEVTLYAENNYGCADTTSQIIEIFEKPEISFDYQPQFLCAPADVSFMATGVNVASYHWLFGDGNSANIQNPTHTYSTAGNYSVVVTATSPENCTNFAQQNIEISQPPQAAFTAVPSIAYTYDPISFQDLSVGANSWAWSFDDGHTSVEQNPTHAYERPGIYMVELAVESSNNCTDTTTQQVIIHEQATFYLPNAFNPNGNGLNDYFGPVGEGINNDSFEMYVFDRWGKQIFYTNDVNQKWDGKSKDGTLMPQGVYTWVILLKKHVGTDHKYRYTGTVTLL